MSEALGAEAAKSAAALKAERLAAAKRKPVPSDGSKNGSKSSGSTGRNAGKKKTPATKKKQSSTKASNKRKQAARDRRS